MGIHSSVRLSWSEICSNVSFRGRWVALDEVRYDDTSSRPAEGTVVDVDSDLGELCHRLRETNRRSCAIVHCEASEAFATNVRMPRGRLAATH